MIVLIEKESIYVNKFVGSDEWYLYPWHSDNGGIVFPGEAVEKMVQKKDLVEVRDCIIQRYDDFADLFELVKCEDYVLPNILRTKVLDEMFDIENEDVDFGLVEAAIVGLLLQKDISVVVVDYGSVLHGIMNKYILD